MMLSPYFYQCMTAALRGETLLPTVEEPLKGFVKAHWASTHPHLTPEFSLDCEERYDLACTSQEIPKPMQVGIMFSGGIDSTIAPFYMMEHYGFAPEDIHLISVDYGQPYNAAEASSQRRIAEWFQYEYGIRHVATSFRPIQHLDEKTFPQGYIIPFRNVTMASVGLDLGYPFVVISANWRGAEAGKKEGSGVSDKSEEFFAEFSCLASKVKEQSHRVFSPVSHLSKAETVEFLLSVLGYQQGVNLLQMTSSCYSATVSRWACGECYTCYKNAKMFQHLGLQKLLDTFPMNPLKGPNAKMYEEREQAKGRS